jgi:hypothetical protein
LWCRTSSETGGAMLDGIADRIPGVFSEPCRKLVPSSAFVEAIIEICSRPMIYWSA